MNMKHAQSEAGNVFFLILLGVALFAAFTAAVMSSSSKGGSANPDRDKLEATNIIKYGNTLKSAVDQLRSRGGLSESDISFANSTVSGYGTVGANPTAEVFHIEGGGIAYETPDSRWLNSAFSLQTGYGEWRFTGVNPVYLVGTPSTGNCGAASSCKELLAVLMFVKESVCDEINKQLGTTDASGNPHVSTSPADVTKFTGTFGSSAYHIRDTADELGGVQQACIGISSIPGSYHYYHVLIAR